MKALVIRLGAYGDLVFITPVLKKLKEEGYHVTVNVRKNQSDAVLKNNPHIDKFIYHDANVVTEELETYWKKLSEGYDRVINFSSSIEDGLLVSESDPRNKEHVHNACNVNYFDQTMKWAGYKDKGLNGELFFTPLEISEARKIRKKHSGKFIVLWSMSGSSFHKAYPYTIHIMKTALNLFPDMVFFVVGDGYCEVFEKDLQHERIKNYINKWSMRKTMLITKFVDLVIGPETGVLVAAGCFDTPKIILMSHSSHENLPKYWKNTDVLSAGVACQPCHRLIYNRDYCELDPLMRIPVCMSKLMPGPVLQAIHRRYEEKKNGPLSRVG